MNVRTLQVQMARSGAVTDIDIDCADLSCAPQGAGFIEWTNLSEEGQDPGPSDEIEFTLRYNNAGSSDVFTAEIVAYYPTNKFDYVLGSGGSNDDSGDIGTVSFENVTINAGATETFTFTLKVAANASGTGTVASEVYITPLPDPDSVPGDLSVLFEGDNLNVELNDGQDDECIVTFNALPVELVAFEALVNGRAATLSWQTASETNNAGFEIQHRYLGQAGKTDGTFEVLSFVEGYGTTLEARHYSYPVHDLAPGRHVFRLRQLDYDGTFAYSPEVEIAVEMPEAFLVSPVYPNPFNPQASFSFGVHQAQAVTVRLFDVLGREVASLWQGQAVAGQTQTVTIDGSSLQSGTYFLRVEGERFVETQTVVLLK